MGRLSANWLQKHGFAPGDVFVQTGTQNGVTLKYCAPLFKTIHTIELDQTHFERSRDYLAKYKNIHCHHGSSPVVLTRIVEAKQATVFWLDAHYVASDPSPGQVNNQCPLLWELSSIFRKRWKVPLTILIDDAHFFQPSFWKLYRSRAYQKRQWPRQSTIRAKAEHFGYTLRQIDDVLVIEKARTT